jgi:hypothetical protein
MSVVKDQKSVLITGYVRHFRYQLGFAEPSVADVPQEGLAMRSQESFILEVCQILHLRRGRYC